MVNFGELRRYNLKSIADILPGGIFTMEDDEGYVSYFLDKMDSGSDLAKAFTVFRNALASRTPMTMEDVCAVIDAYRVADFLSQKGTENLTPALYRDLAGEYERYIRNAESVIKILGQSGLSSLTQQEKLKLEKSKALKEYYTDRLEYCRQQGAKVKVETPSESALSDAKEEKAKPERKAFSLFSRRDKGEKKEEKPVEKPADAEKDAPASDEDDIVIPGGVAIPAEEPVKEPVRETAEEPVRQKPVRVFIPDDDDEEPEKTEEVSSEKEEKPARAFVPKDDDDEEGITVSREAQPEEPKEEPRRAFIPVDDDDEEPDPGDEVIPYTRPEPDEEKVEESPEPEIEPEPVKEQPKPVAKPEPEIKPAPAPVKPVIPAVREEPEKKVETKPVFGGAFTKAREQEQTLKEMEAVRSKTEAGEIPYYERSLSFNESMSCKDIKAYSLINAKGTVYFGLTENIKGSHYDNSDETLLELTRIKPEDDFVSFMTEDRLDAEKPFSKDEKKAMRTYFGFVSVIFNENVGRTATAGEYIRFKKYYNALVDKMLELEEEEKALYFKALMYADRYISYAKAYNIEPSEGDREKAARAIIAGDTAGITDDYGIIKEFHIADDEARENIEKCAHLIEIFPDEEREEEKLPELPAIYKNVEPRIEEEPALPPGAALPVYDNPYNGGYGTYGNGYGMPPYGQTYQQPATPVQVIVNNNFPGAYTNNGTNNQNK